MSKTLIAYYSQSGSTKRLADLKEIQGFSGKVVSVKTSVGQNDDKYNADEVLASLD